MCFSYCCSVVWVIHVVISSAQEYLQFAPIGQCLKHTYYQVAHRRRTHLTTHTHLALVIYDFCLTFEGEKRFFWARCRRLPYSASLLYFLIRLNQLLLVSCGLALMNAFWPVSPCNAAQIFCSCAYGRVEGAAYLLLQYTCPVKAHYPGSALVGDALLMIQFWVLPMTSMLFASGMLAVLLISCIVHCELTGFLNSGVRHARICYHKPGPSPHFSDFYSRASPRYSLCRGVRTYPGAFSIGR